MATKSKDVTNNGIYSMLTELAVEATQNLLVVEFSPAYMKSKGSFPMSLLGVHLMMNSLHMCEDIKI